MRARSIASLPAGFALACGLYAACANDTFGVAAVGDAGLDGVVEAQAEASVDAQVADATPDAAAPFRCADIEAGPNVVCDDFDDSPDGGFKPFHWSAATGDLAPTLATSRVLSAPYSLKLIAPDPDGGTYFRVEKTFPPPGLGVMTCELDFSIDSNPLNDETGGSYMIRLIEGNSQLVFVVRPMGPALGVLPPSGTPTYKTIGAAGWPTRFPAWHHVIVTANFAQNIGTISFDGQVVADALPSPSSGVVQSTVSVGAEVSGDAGNRFHVYIDNVLVTVAP
ncbi:MAG: hypothetical protein ABIP89_24460 [Polyangiaceae bacterium]